MAMEWKALTAQELAAPITRKNFWHRAHHHGRNVLGLPSDQWPAIKPGMDEWHAWGTYFHVLLGWIPGTWQIVAREHQNATKVGAVGQLEFTVPTLFPEQFDPAGWSRIEEYRRRSIGRIADQAFATHLKLVDQEAGAI